MLRFYDEVLDAPTLLHSGTQRAATLEATWKRFSPAAKRAGITRIADITGLDTLGIPVFTAVRPMGKSLSTQQGKGVSPEAARVSALMESLETYSAENITAKRIRGSYRALREKHDVVDVRKLARAKKRLDLDETWTWLEGWHLSGFKKILVPEQCVTLDTTFTKQPVFDISSNGLASGNVRVEAIVHGLYEVFERDAEARWRRSGSDRRIVLDTITDPTCRELIERIVATGARIFVWHMPTDAEVAAIACAIMEDPHEPAWRPLGMYQGFGAHFMPEIAIARAVTEAAQTRLTYIAGGRDDFFPFDYERATDPGLLADIWERLAAPCDEPVTFDDLPRYHDAGNTLGYFLEMLVLDAPQTVVVDVTHPELLVPTVKVIVPGRATDVEALG